MLAGNGIRLRKKLFALQSEFAPEILAALWQPLGPRRVHSGSCLGYSVGISEALVGPFRHPPIRAAGPLLLRTVSDAVKNVRHCDAGCL